jgi:tetratricopeptide (TPR) repeat protein
VTPAGLAALGIGCAAVLAMALWGHPVGDYHAESDFYGGYAAGARLIQHGHIEPGRYPVVGPLYEFALALFGFLFKNLFLAAKLLSALAACTTLALWFVLLRRAASATTALWGVALLAANPVLLRYGYSASTDMLALCLSSAALFALVAARGARAPLLAGALAALAALTRYSAVVLMPAGLLAIAFRPREGVSRVREAAWFVAGFAVVAGPWIVFASAAGHVPGAPLLQFFSFYANPSSDRSVQDLGPATSDSLRAYRSLGDLLRHDPASFVRGVLRNIPEHMMLDARDLIGWPIAVLAVLGIPVALLSRAGRALAPVWLAGALQFLALAPVFHSERYALPLVPVELSLAALALAWPRAWVGAVVGALAVAYSLRASTLYQLAIYSQLPTEVVGAGRALAHAAEPASRVLSRKGHIGYYSGVPGVALPRLATLAELGDYARANRADYLYYSWYEAQLRPEFAYLLDTTSAVPGLSVVHATERKPSVLYRIGPDFGAEPSWSRDEFARQLHLARALVDVLPASEGVSHRVTLAVDALERDRPDVALALVEDALRVRDDNALAWEVKGHALERLGRIEAAIDAYRRAVALEPENIETQVWLGWALMKHGDDAEAAAVWTPTISRTTNVAALRAMESLFRKLGKTAEADAARAATAKLEPHAPKR